MHSQQSKRGVDIALGMADEPLVCPVTDCDLELVKEVEPGLSKRTWQGTITRPDRISYYCEKHGTQTPRG
ncbi:hypothetical protein ACVWWN_002212 [Mycobacterium sp. URHB0021]